MIKHIVMFRLKDAQGRTATENALEAQKKAAVLKEKINCLKNIEAVVNADGADGGNYHFALVCEFDSIDDLNKYQVHPEHLKFGAFISEVKESRACIDYEC